MALIALMLLIAAIALTVTLVRSRTVVTARDIAWLARDPVVPVPEAEIYSRYLRRHRSHRAAGGSFGIIFAIMFGVRWGGTVSLGIGQHSPLADVLFCGLGGVLVGALSAETFRLREPTSTTVAASLTDRAELVDPEYVRLARWIAGASIVVALLVVISGEFGAAFIAFTGAGLAAVAEATRAAIDNRRRPLLSAQAIRVDHQIRSFAATSVTLLQLAAAVLIFGWVIAQTPSINSALDLLSVAVILGSLFLTVRLMRRASPRPPKLWTVDQP